MKNLLRIIVVVACLALTGCSYRINSPSGRSALRNACFIVVSKQDMTLKVIDFQSAVLASYPVACGKNFGNKRCEGDMKTPEGVWKVQSIEDATEWTHDFNDGKGVIEGAYGQWFVRLYAPPHNGIGIHGTHDENSIGQRVTEGCIRLRNADLVELQRYVYVDMPVVIIGSAADVAADLCEE